MCASKLFMIAWLQLQLSPYIFYFFFFSQSESYVRLAFVNRLHSKKQKIRIRNVSWRHIQMTIIQQTMISLLKLWRQIIIWRGQDICFTNTFRYVFEPWFHWICTNECWCPILAFLRPKICSFYCSSRNEMTK